jgi:hypothetical protein
MKTLQGSASDEEILGVVRQWVKLLAAGDFDAAYALIDHDAYHGWTPDLMRRVVEGCGHPESTPTRHCVSPIAEASGGPTPRHEVARWDPPRDLGSGSECLGCFWFDLRLDGSWSDMTATFEIMRRGEKLSLVLGEIHMM